MKKHVLFLLALLPLFAVNANNIALTNLTTSYNSNTGVVTADFDLSWENSWRTNAIYNWDAAWVVFKYKEAGIWKHLDLTGNNITLPSGYTSSVPFDKKGIFIYRDAAGTGNVSLTGCKVGLLPQMGTYDLKAFALEMVYIPAGGFYLGDGSSGTYGRYRQGAGSAPYYMAYGNCQYLQLGNTYSFELYDSLGTGSFANGFPGGYDAGYCMKYELSQAAYRDFLNCLTYQQQTSRTSVAPSSTVGTNALVAGNRQFIEIKTAGTASTVPAVYGCDANGNNTFDEYDDGEWVAITNVNWQDMCAFLDWAALRPMTEFEFEKICRGTNTANVGEYAWGTNTIDVSSFTLNGKDKSNEVTTNAVTFGSANFYTRNPVGINGPLRNGIFANSSSGRSSSGGSFYGVMEMSGNVYELVVSTSTVAGKCFTGLTGNGTLNLSGDADVDYWPGLGGVNNYNNTVTTYDGTNGVTDGAGSGSRGGTWYWNEDLCRISNRNTSNLQYVYRISQPGIRGVRSPY